MLTINADGHDLMCQFYKSVDEKRMVVILPPDSYDHWLKATPQQSMEVTIPRQSRGLSKTAAKSGRRNRLRDSLLLLNQSTLHTAGYYEFQTSLSAHWLSGYLPLKHQRKIVKK